MGSKVSIPSNGSIQFLLFNISFNDDRKQIRSQSPQTGQFNSYRNKMPSVFELTESIVSIPSNGSIQFLQVYQTPTGKRNNIQSQSPQTGQFNSYLLSFFKKVMEVIVSIPSNGSIQFLQKQYITIYFIISVSIPSNGSIQFLR